MKHRLNRGKGVQRSNRLYQITYLNNKLQSCSTQVFAHSHLEAIKVVSGMKDFIKLLHAGAK